MKHATALLICTALCAADGYAQEPTLGAELYATHCAGCHGSNGEGGGPLAAATATNVPNLRTLRMRNGGVFPADAVTAYIDGRETPAAHFSRQMPVWGEVFEGVDRNEKKLVAGRIAALVGFIAELQYP
jgi:mono/diheme cytochrome c family protein